MTNPPLEYPRTVRRVRVRWKDGEWSIVKEMVIPRMTLPKSSEPPATRGDQGVSGFWWEATDAKGTALYRRAVTDPTVPRVEIPEQDGTFRHLPVAAHEVVFDVLVPDLPEIEEIRFFSDQEEGQELADRGRRKRGPSRLSATLKLRKTGGYEPEGGPHGRR